MPYSFTKIEEDKTRTISFVFSFLVVLYFLVFWVIASLIKSYAVSESEYTSYYFTLTSLNFPQTLIVLAAAFAIGYAHWSFATSHLTAKILGVLKAEPLNPEDTYHQMLKNIVGEVSVATGGRTMEAVVIPTAAMNAFAIADFSGRALIGVTEGALARLTRAQLEAVIGHEAAHIITGDCLSTTVISSLFEMVSGFLRGFENIFRFSGHRRSTRGNVRSGGGALAMVLLIYFLLLVTKFLSQLARMFISRQREYRADAIAVRLTRDPLSLAEALYAIAYRWRGAGLPAQELEAIFIVPPVFSDRDEQDGLWAEMFCTHPPMKRRLAVLLEMAHSDAKRLADEVERKNRRPRILVPDADEGAMRWMVHRDGAWQGPFDLAQVATSGWICPETWIQRLGTKNVRMAHEDADIKDVFKKTVDENQNESYNCPQCQRGLNTMIYEGLNVYRCRFCRGTLLEESDVQRVIIRQEIGFSDKILRIAEGIRKEDSAATFKTINRDPKMLFVCPRCLPPHAKMMRMFYTEAYHVEIDKCFSCGAIWFDRDELEILQILIEQQTNSS